MSDREDILRVLDTYCEYADGGRFRDWAELFTKDGCFEAFGRRFEGRAKLEKFISRAPRGVHTFREPEIQIDGDSARVKSPFRFEAEDAENHSRGTYLDRLRREAGGWRFVHREVEFSARGADALKE